MIWELRRMGWWLKYQWYRLRYKRTGSLNDWRIMMNNWTKRGPPGWAEVVDRLAEAEMRSSADDTDCWYYGPGKTGESE